jgi:hypothetical protein
MALSNGNSFTNRYNANIPGSLTEPWWIRILGPVQPGADPDGGMA